MALPFALLLLAAGFVLLVGGAEGLVRGACSIARRFGVSDLAIGLTVVAFGTSMPEMVVSLLAALEGKAEIALGNVIGSNQFNILVILAFAGLVAPLPAHPNTMWKEVPQMLGVSLLVILLCRDGWFGPGPDAITRFDAGLLLVAFVLFLRYVGRTMRDAAATEQGEPSPVYGTALSLLLIVVGLGALVGGGRLVIDAASSIARGLGVSERVIGLTIVAGGTSLPELATSCVAAFRGKADIAIGNVVGSNIFNILLILGVSAAIRPIPCAPEFGPDLWVMLGAALLLWASLFTGMKGRIDRWEAGLFLLGYAGYLGWLVTRAPALSGAPA